MDLRAVTYRDVPDINAADPDTAWIPKVANRKWIAVTHDKKLRSKRAERHAIQNARLRVVVIALPRTRLRTKLPMSSVSTESRFLLSLTTCHRLSLSHSRARNWSLHGLGLKRRPAWRGSRRGRRGRWDSGASTRMPAMKNSAGNRSDQQPDAVQRQRRLRHVGHVAGPLQHRAADQRRQTQPQLLQEGPHAVEHALAALAVWPARRSPLRRG